MVMDLHSADALFAAAQSHGFDATSRAIFESVNPQDVPTVFPRDGQLRQNALVRCLGMIQDVQGEHTFLCGSSAKFFTDVVTGVEAECGDDAIRAPTYTLYVVPVPGHRYVEKGATLDAVDKQRDGEVPFRPSRTLHRRPRDEDDEVDETMVDDETPIANHYRPHRSEQPAHRGSGTVGNENPLGDTSLQGALRLPHPAAHEGLQCGVVAYIPEEALLSCEGNLRPMDVVELYGFIAPDSAPSSNEDDGADELPQWRAETLPTGLVRTLVVAAARKVDDLTGLHRGVVARASMNEVRHLRSQVVSSIANAFLGGDQLAAEYLVLHLVSSTVRHTSGVAVGALSLNLSAVPEPRILADFLSRVLPAAVSLPISNDRDAEASCIREYSWALEHSFETNSLSTSPLQLPSAGCHVTLIDTSRDPSAWEEDVISAASREERDASQTGGNAWATRRHEQRNRALLEEVLMRQHLELDYTYHKVHVRTNLTCLLLSAGAPSNACSTLVDLPVVPQQHERSEGSGGAHNLTEDEMTCVRRFVNAAGHLHRQGGTVSSDDPYWKARQAYFSEDLVAAQQQRPKMFRPTSLIHLSTQNAWLTIARCVASVAGDTDMELTHWEAMKVLEMARFERLTA